ncbi:zinc finger BED domain-containing protein 4-like [Tachysurus ichikawai]
MQHKNIRHNVKFHPTFQQPQGKEAEHVNIEQTGHGDEEEQIEGDKTGQRLYDRKQTKSTHSSPAAQLNHYLDNCDGQNCLLLK